MDPVACRTCGFDMPAKTTFCDGCGAMAPAPKSSSLSPRFMMATSGYPSGYSPDFYGSGGFPESKGSKDSEDDYTYAPAPRSNRLLIIAATAVVVMICAGVWWWQRGAEVTVTISPARSAVTFDGDPLTVTNGQAVLQSVKRGAHMMVIKPPNGGTLYHSVDVSFFESAQTVQINLPQPAGSTQSTQSARMAEPHYARIRRTAISR